VVIRPINDSHKRQPEDGALYIDLTFPHSYDVEEVHQLRGIEGIDVPASYVSRSKAQTGTRRPLVKYPGANC
jgi:hypothetical protein